MPVFSYKTIQAASEGLYKEKGSKFLAFAYSVESEEEVHEKLDLIKKEYYDARHHCYAFMLGSEQQKFRAFDDGEPNHSAGDPILGQIRSKGLTNILIVVVRYFGGVKLGVGGLIGAYKAAAEDALKKAVIIEKEVTETLRLVYDYANTPEVMRLVKQFDLTVKKQEFNESCELIAEIKLRNKLEFDDKLQLMKALGVKVEERKM